MGVVGVFRNCTGTVVVVVLCRSLPFGSLTLIGRTSFSFHPSNLTNCVAMKLLWAPESRSAIHGRSLISNGIHTSSCVPVLLRYKGGILKALVEVSIKFVFFALSTSSTLL